MHLGVITVLAGIVLQFGNRKPAFATSDVAVDFADLTEITSSRTAEEIVSERPALPSAATPHQIVELPREVVYPSVPQLEPMAEFSPEEPVQYPPLGIVATKEESVPPPVPQSKSATVTANRPPTKTTKGQAAAPAGPKPPARFVQATVRSRSAPAYPRSSRKRGEQGTTRVKVSISTSGKVSSASVAQSSGSASLDKAALAAAKRWRFNAARRGDQPTTSQLVIPITFRLQ